MKCLFFTESSEAVPPCPVCGGALHYRDTRKRIFRQEGGQTEWILVRRFRCESCRRYHTELPDCLTPYKHYGTELICGVIDEYVSADDADSEQYPSEITMERWKEWARQNSANMEGHLYRAADRVAGNKAGSAAGSFLEELKRRTERITGNSMPATLITVNSTLPDSSRFLYPGLAFESYTPDREAVNPRER